MSKKQITGLILGGITIMILAVVALGGWGYNKAENFTVVQYPNGAMKSYDNNGIYPKWFGKTDTYPDKDIIYFSKDTREGSNEDESIETLFTDKGKGWWSFQVTVNNPTSEPEQIAFHMICKGDYDYFRNSVNARLKSASRKWAEKKTASEAAENQSEFVDSVEGVVKADEMIDTQFHSKIIAVELTGVEFDTQTKNLFVKQQEALLLQKQAEIDKGKYVQQTLATQAEYEQKIAKTKGEADMVKMKAVTDAEREKELATIEASKQVAVAELQTQEQEQLKKKAEVEASRELEVAKLNKQAAEEQAAAQKLLADAREYQIQKGGAIAEKDKVLAEIAAKRDAMVAAELSKVQVPYMVVNGGAANGGTGLTDTMFNMKLMESMGLLDLTKVQDTQASK